MERHMKHRTQHPLRFRQAGALCLLRLSRAGAAHMCARSADERAGGDEQPEAKPNVSAHE